MKISFNNTNYNLIKPAGFSVCCRSMHSLNYCGASFGITTADIYLSAVDSDSRYTDKITEIKKKAYFGRNKETLIQRASILKKWFDFVPVAYNKPETLFILNGITHDLKENDDNLPPALNIGILRYTINSIKNSGKRPEEINFSKEYSSNLRNYYIQKLKDKNIDNNETGWVVIPSKENDPDNYYRNIETLKILSHHNWCTKSFGAEDYLPKGDFHIYLEEGKTKIGIAFEKNKIIEIQGEKNNSKIPVEYVDIIKDRIANCDIDDNVKKEINNAEKIKINLV